MAEQKDVLSNASSVPKQEAEQQNERDDILASSTANPLLDPTAALASLQHQAHEKKAELNSLLELRKSLLQEMHDLKESIISGKTKNRENRQQMKQSIEQHKQKSIALRSLNEKITHAIEELKKHEPQKQQKHEGMSLQQLARQIEHYERVIETEAVPFDKEQKIMEKIKELKKAMQGIEASLAVHKEYKSLISTLHTLKQERKELYKQTHALAKEIDNLKLQIEQTSEQITRAEEKEKVVKQSLDELSQKITAVKDSMQTTIHDLNHLKAQTKQIRKKEQEKEQEKLTLSLKEKIAAVNEKIKKGEKLTTEDFLLLQNAEKNHHHPY
ncbi:MAG: hypothetical protein QW594_01295 [Candidatus Woesearchaeota archaeon]